VKDSLDLNLTKPEIKTDAANLMFSFKNGKVISARNKGHIKNFGEKAITLSEVSKFFAKHGDNSFTIAMLDLQQALSKLSKRQAEKIFGEGKNWMSVEVMTKTTENVINYQGLTELRFHGTIEHNEDGEKVSQINKENARILDGMLRQKNAERQSMYTLKKLTPASFNAIKSVDKHRDELITQIEKVMGGTNSIDEYKRASISKLIIKHTSNKELIQTLLNRWVDQDKSKTITSIYKENPDDKDWIKELDSEIATHFKEIMLPLEYIFLKLGNIVVGSLNVFMTLDKDKTIREIQKNVTDAIELINSKGGPESKAKLDIELKRLSAAGGISRINPEEGVTFFIGDEFFKLTGTFAPTNQIINMIR
jgi:hypothetical protein